MVVGTKSYGQLLHYELGFSLPGQAKTELFSAMLVDLRENCL